MQQQAAVSMRAGRPAYKAAAGIVDIAAQTLVVLTRSGLCVEPSSCKNVEPVTVVHRPVSTCRWIVYK